MAQTTRKQRPLHQAPMMKGTIRKGSSQDTAAILAVMEDVYEASPWKLEQIEADLEQESIFYFLAVDEGQVLGFVAIQENSSMKQKSYRLRSRRLSRPRRPAQQLLAQLLDQKEIFLDEAAHENVGNTIELQSR